MGGGSQTQTSFTKTDPWGPAQPALNQALQGAMDAYNTTYQGPQIAAMDPLVTQGQQQVVDNANAGNSSALANQIGSNFTNLAGNNGLSQAQSGAQTGITDALGSFNANQNKAMGYIDPYASGAMRDNNPYLNSSISNAMQDASGAINRQFSASGRYGSGAQTDALASRLGSIATDARMNAYNQDTQNQLNAIGQLGNLNSNSLSGNLQGQGAVAGIGQQGVSNLGAILGSSGALNELRNLDASSLMGVGGQKMAYNQSQIDAANSAPWARAGNLAQIAGGIGGLGGTSFGIKTTENSGGMPAVGGALSALGGIGNLFSSGGAAAGAGGGISSFLSTLPALFAASDERLKDNVTPIGKLNDGQNVYSYTYKGDSTPQIGLLAQEVEKRTPEAVWTDPKTGFKAVRYDLATARARAA